MMARMDRDLRNVGTNSPTGLRGPARRCLAVIRDIVFIALITIVLLEIGLRIFHHFRPLPIFYDDSYNRFRIRPHLPIYGFQTNSRGFYDVERTREKSPGIYRVLGIGDSFSFGIVPHEFNYLTRIEKQIKQVRPGFELFNMGIPGLSPREYLALLLNEGLDLRPDMVLLSFFAGNDFAETAKIDRIYRISYTANIVKYFYAVATKVGDHGVPTASTYKDNAPTLTEDAFLEIETFGLPLFQKDNARFENALPNTMAHLRAIKQVCDLHGIHLTIIIIPDEMQVNDELLEKVANMKGIAAGELDTTRPNRALSSELTRLSIDHLDLLPKFRAETVSGRLYKPNDSHWNIRGNEIAAKLIFDHILQKTPVGPRQQPRGGVDVR